MTVTVVQVVSGAVEEYHRVNECHCFVLLYGDIFGTAHHRWKRSGASG